jgi:signal peptidase I
LEDNNIPEFDGNQYTSRKRAFFKNFLEILEMLAMALALYFVIDFAVGRVRVQKISMEPTLMPGEILLVNKLEYKFGPMERGDIITFHFPLDPSMDYVKRIIGLPGDRVVVQGGQVWVNDRLLYEPYISAADNLFVLGDNRNPSEDSHAWGYVPAENVIGKAFAVYWPIPKIRGLPTPNIFAP